MLPPNDEVGAPLVRICEEFVAAYHKARMFDLETHMDRAVALGIDRADAKRELLNAALRVADQEDDPDALAGLENSSRGDLTDGESRFLLGAADYISEKADLAAEKARIEASGTVRDGLIALTRAGKFVSDADLAREVNAGRLRYEHYRIVRTTREALQPPIKGPHACH
jgi:hypothetical protein